LSSGEEIFTFMTDLVSARRRRNIADNWNSIILYSSVEVSKYKKQCCCWNCLIRGCPFPMD